MKKLTAIICLALCALLCLSGMAVAESATPNVDAIKAAGKIVMLTNAAFPPFEYLGDFIRPDGTEFCQTLQEYCDLRWNICTEAEEVIAVQGGNFVFFLMCPSSLEG